LTYRFKTRDEFIKEFGDSWVFQASWNEDMNKYFGTTIEIGCFTNGRFLLPDSACVIQGGNWFIFPRMLVKIDRFHLHRERLLVTR
jgi:hypothetical protein